MNRNQIISVKKTRRSHWGLVRDTMNIKSYLDMFERYAHDANWEFEAYASNLGRLLSGKALDVYSKLPLASANKYDTLKQALLELYQLKGQCRPVSYYVCC